MELFIDTSYCNLLVYLLENKEIVKFKRITDVKSLSTKALETIDNCLKEEKKEIKDVKRIYVVTGPGSFTGLRVGITIVKTIAYLKKIDVIGISSLEVMASTITDTDIIIPYIDARRGYVYAGMYDKELSNIFEDRYISLQSLKNSIPESKTYKFVSYDNLIENTYLPSEEVTRILEKHRNDNPMNIHGIKPNYLKKTEAEEKANV